MDHSHEDEPDGLVRVDQRPEGHEMTPIQHNGRQEKRPSYDTGPEDSGEMRLLEISIDDAIELLDMGKFQYRILVAAGLCFAADSMEVLLLTFLAVVLQELWELTPEQTAAMTSAVFVGALLGTLTLGPLGDRIGRKPVFSLTAAIICVFGFATAAVHSFAALVVCRFLVGFGVGGLTVPFDTLAEFVPTSHRGTNLLAIEYFWTGGTLLVPVLAWLSLGDGSNENSWRLFVFLCGVPCLLSTILGLLVVPESPRWLLAKGRHDEALQGLRQAAVINGRDPMELFPLGTQLTDDEDAEDSSNFAELLAPHWRRITLLLWGTWAGFAFTYYGTIITVTLVFADEAEAGLDEEGRYSFDYGAIFASASSELAGTTLVILLVDVIGRIPLQAGSYLFGGISVLLLCFVANQAEPSRALSITLAFLSRMMFMGGSCTTWVSTAEILPTEIRTTGHSAANAVARFSGIFSPFLVQASTPFPVIGIVMFAVSTATAAFSWMLPETKGKHMGTATKQESASTETKPQALQTGSYGII